MKRSFLIIALIIPSLAVAGVSKITVACGQRDISSMAELDPHELVSENLADIVRNIYDTLYEVKSDGSFTEGLATNCDVRSSQEDVEYNTSMEIVCKIRTGVYFHDGLELTPYDIVFSILRAKNSKTLASPFDFIKDVQVAGTDSVRFILSYKAEGIDDTATWLFEKFKRALARHGYIVRADYFIGGAGWALEYPVGTGPFYFKDWKLWDTKNSRSQIILMKNKSYWRTDLPKIDEVDFRFLPSTMWVSGLKDGSIALLYRIPYGDYKDLLKVNSDKGFFKLSKRLEYSYQYLLFTPGSKITKSLDVKRAFFSGISREKIVKNVLGKNAVVNSGRSLYAGSVYPEKFPVLPYKPSTSRTLVSSYLRMNGSKYKSGRLPVSIVASDRSEDMETAQEIEKQLSLAGFDPKITILQLGSYKALMNKGDLSKYDMVLYSVNESPTYVGSKVRKILKNGGMQLYQRYLFYAMSRPDADTTSAGALRVFSPPAEGPLRLLDAE